MLVAWILLAAGLVLIALTAVYVAAEFSLVTVDRADVERRADDGDEGAAAIRRGLTRLSTQLSAAQVGITVTTLALGYVMEPSLATLLIAPLGALGLGAAAVGPVSVAIALAVATVLSMVFGELVPKNIAIARPLGTARRVIAINSITTAVCKPLIWALNGAANATVRLFGMEPTEELGAARSARELESLVRRSGEQGSLATDSAQLVAQTLRFSAKQAYDVVTPRVDVVTVRADEDATAVIQSAAASGLSRFPVIGRDIDDILGLVHVKRAIAIQPADRAGVRVDALMVDAPRVPGTVTLDELLPTLRRRGLQMVVVLDEYGGTEGIVTLEDVVEELLGEISDEHDSEAERWHRSADGALVVSGALRPDEIAEATGLILPDALEYETIAGLVTERLGRLPAIGDSVVVRAALRPEARLGGQSATSAMEPDPLDTIPRPVDVGITVTDVDGRRVATVELRAVAGPRPSDETAGGQS